MREPLDDKIEWIKTHLDMRQILEMCGIDPPDRQHKIRSIYVPKERTPSMHIYPDHFFCYATGKGGDQIQFVRDYKNMRMRDAVEFLAGGGDPNSRRIELDTPEVLPDFTEIFRTAPDFQPDPLAVAQKDLLAHQALDVLRGQKWPTLSLQDIGTYGNKLVGDKLWSPHYHLTDKGWIVRGIKTRSVYTGVKRAVKGSTFREGLYRCAWRSRYDRPAVLVEGESDTWVLTKAAPRVDVFGLPSGAGLWRDQWRDELLPYTKVLVCLDGDTAGQEAADRVTGSIESAGGCVITIDVPGGRVAEAVAEGWNIDG